MKRVLSILLCLMLCIPAAAAFAEESSAVAQGFGGEVRVTVSVQNGKIISVTATGENETPGVGSRAIEQLPKMILAAQSADIDALSGCTVSSNAVLKAAKEAIAAASGTETAAAQVVMTPGTYTGRGAGYGIIGQLALDVTVDETSIVSITVNDPNRETANIFQAAVDLLIPRGGAGLINSVVQNSTVPVIQTGVGNCHVFVDESADLEKAARIVINAKTQRPGVCNACESLLVHEAIAEKFMPEIGKALQERKVEIRGDEATQGLVSGAVPATEADWATEYEDYIISARVVKDIDEAIRHIRKYSTGHSEAIVTENYTNAQRFLNEVDAAAVYVNASTRFTDGGQFGFGAEIGISTQKLHARGPMGLKELTTTKYIIYGNGQIRE